MKHKIFSHTSLLIILSVILTFLAAGTVMYNRYDIYMKQGVRDEAAYIKTGLEEDGRDFLTDKIGDATSSRITLLGKDGDVLFDSIESFDDYVIQFSTAWRTGMCDLCDRVFSGTEPDTKAHRTD